jgi:thiamine pyrophosphate-dependent acetolactate synthase large subunit-like protein
LSADGVGTHEIMRRTGKSKTCVWRWQERFMQAGYDGLLRDKTRPSRIPPLGSDIAERVIALTRTDPPVEATHWTASMMAKAVGISASSVQRIWRAHGLQPHRVQQFKLSNDPKFIDKLRDVVGPSAKRINADQFAAWRRTLSDGDAAKREAPGVAKPMDELPIHPLRLCDEIKNFMQRDAILVVDGQEILNFGRQSMPTFVPGHRLNSGPFGTMGVGLPFGIGAKLAKPDKQVIVVHGDGSFGINALELDTAVRHNIPILVVISLNGGWSADPQGDKPGRNLGYTRFDRMAEAFGCYGEYVERPDEIRPALHRAQKEVDRGSVALVNVKTDGRARATTVAFSQYMT